MGLDQFLCKNCGANLDVSTAVGGVVKCPYCGSTYTVPKDDASADVRTLIRLGSHEFDKGDFDAAYTAFKSASALDAGEPEAYWGMALAEYKVRYLRDTVKNRLQPICQSYNGKSFLDNENYRRALSLSTEEQRDDYREKAKEIDHIRERFRELKASGLNYDCFICVKVREEDGVTFTPDSRTADNLYDLLRNKGYAPFYSERKIQNRTGSDYEAEILYALTTAETMLVVCFDEKWLRTPWVQNEYTRFLALMQGDEKESDSLTIVFKGTPVEKLPGRPGKIQGIDISKPDAAVKVLDFVETHTPKARARREEEARKKQREAEELKEQMEAQRREFEERQLRLQRELENKMKSMSGGASSIGVGTNTASLLKRAAQEMEFNNFGEARNYFNKVLDVEPENCEAWWGLFLTDFEAKHENSLKDRFGTQLQQKIQQNRNYLSANKYAAGSPIEQRVKDFESYQNTLEAWWNAFLREMFVDHEQKLLDRITANLYNRITNNSAYAKATDIVAVTDKKDPLCDRVQKFDTVLESANVQWLFFFQDFLGDDIDLKSFLQDFDKYKTALLDRMSADDLEKIEDNDHYSETKLNLGGKLFEQYLEFDNAIHSCALWWDKFLKQKHVPESDILSEYVPAEYSGIINNKAFLLAVKFAGKEKTRPAVLDFKDRIVQQDKHATEAEASFKAFLSKYGGDDMYNKSTDVTNDKLLTDALENAKKANYKKLIADIEKIKHDQSEAAARNSSELHALAAHYKKNRIVKIILIILSCGTLALPISMLLFRFGVKFFDDLFVVSAFMYFGEAFETITVVVAIAFIICSVVCFIGATRVGKQRALFVPFFALSLIFTCLAFTKANTYNKEFAESGEATKDNYLFVKQDDCYVMYFEETAEDNREEYYSVLMLHAAGDEIDLVIPDTVNNKKVRRVSGRACGKQSKLKSVTIGDNVESIGSEAFKRCENLETVKLGDGVIKIEHDAFEECYALKNVDFGNNLREIGYSAFESCGSLEYIELPDSVTKIGADAFYATGIKKAVLGRELKTLEQSVFGFPSNEGHDVEIYFRGTSETWKNVSKADQGYYAWYGAKDQKDFYTFYVYDESTKDYVKHAL